VSFGSLSEKLVPKLSQKAKGLAETAAGSNEVSLVAKDLSWLWRTAYNCAIQGCSEWEHSEEQISELFDISREVCAAVTTKLGPKICSALA
jgi:hypothetical protein